MTERPQYGELATPEEQRRLAGLPPVEEQPPAPAAAASPEPVAQSREPRRWDRIITIALLVYGVFNVFMTGMSYLDLPGVMNESMRILGIEGKFTNFDQARVWGTIAAIVLVAGWVITALISVRRLRASKLAWWVPLVGAVVTMLVASVCISIPMVGDPAFQAYLAGAGAS
ncbi:DUF6264 family protein [Microbacterium sp. NPDC077644]|uniref:DUF6264 family protein n=1 Tax=Microbacterium sp. NPDC077644 TaxID=3155055 RepID=UPI00344EB732